jgi:hypothetical protein
MSQLGTRSCRSRGASSTRSKVLTAGVARRRAGTAAARPLGPPRVDASLCHLNSPTSPGLQPGQRSRRVVPRECPRTQVRLAHQPVDRRQDKSGVELRLVSTGHSPFTIPASTSCVILARASASDDRTRSATAPT